MTNWKTLCAVAASLVGLTGCGQDEATSEGVSDRVLKACLAPDFDPSEDIPFVSLDSPNYPAAMEKQARMEERHAATPPNETIPSVLVEGAFFLLPMNTLFLPMTTAFCNHDMYAENGCEGMSMLLGDKKALEDIELDGQQLSYVIHDLENDDVTRIVIGDRDYNNVSISVAKDDTTVDYELTRDADGTEHFESQSTEGDTMRFTERPDCSGTFAQRDTQDGDLERTIEFEWTSTKEAPIDVQWHSCRYSGGKRCGSGEF